MNYRKIVGIIIFVLFAFSGRLAAQVDATKDAQTTIVWLGTGDIILSFDGVTYPFSAGQKQMLSFSSLKEYKFAGSASGKQYPGPKKIRFAKGGQNMLLALTQGTLNMMMVGDVADEIAFEMVIVEGGTYNKGCTNMFGTPFFGWESTYDTVTLGDFYMAKFDVTQAQWQAVMGHNPSFFQGCPRCPVENVSWNDTQEFIRRLNLLTGKHYRLPTDAEWEYAARGGVNATGNYFAANKQNVQWNELTTDAWLYISHSPPPASQCDERLLKNMTWNQAKAFILDLNEKTGSFSIPPTEAEWAEIKKMEGYKYAGSNNLDEVAWYYGNSDYKTHPVGEKKANELGLYDMTGNVSQWCNDWFEMDAIEYDYQKAIYGKVQNPQGPITGTKRVVRGGAWNINKFLFRVTLRYGYEPTYRFSDMGFRLVLDI